MEKSRRFRLILENKKKKISSTICYQEFSSAQKTLWTLALVQSTLVLRQIVIIPYRTLVFSLVTYFSIYLRIIKYSSEPWRLGAGRRTPRSLQARVSQVPETVHQLRGGTVSRQAARHLAPAHSLTRVGQWTTVVASYCGRTHPNFERKALLNAPLVNFRIRS